MKQFCHKCLTNNLEEGSCSNCGYVFSSTINERIEDLIYESANSRLALSDEQEKAISRLERKLKKLDLRLEGGKITATDSFSAVVQAGGKMYHINVGFDGLVQVDGAKVDPKKEDVLMGIFKSHQKLAEQPKEATEEKNEEPAKKEGKGKLFKKKDLAESIDAAALNKVAPEVIMTMGDLTAEIMPNGTYTVYEKLYADKRQAVESGGAPRYVAAVVKDLQKRGFKVSGTNPNIRTGLENESIVKEEVVTDIGLVEDSYPEIVDQAMKAGFDKEMAGKFANFMGDRFGKSYFDPSYTQEWIDRFKKGSAWANADSMTRSAMQAAGLHEGVIKEGFERIVLDMLDTAGIQKGAVYFGGGVLHVDNPSVAEDVVDVINNSDQLNAEARYLPDEGVIRFKRKDRISNFMAKMGEAIGADEAPKANVNPDAQLITDDGADGDETSTDFVAKQLDPAIKELGFERIKAHYIADGIMIYYADKASGKKLDIKIY